MPEDTLEMIEHDVGATGGRRRPAFPAALQTMPPLDDDEDPATTPTQKAAAAWDALASAPVIERVPDGTDGRSTRSVLAMYLGAFVGGLFIGTLLLAPWTGTPLTEAGATTPLSDASHAPTQVTRSAQAAMLVDEGFEHLETDAALAATKFREALDLVPGTPSAAYGLGITHANAGRMRSAKDWLCRVVDAPGAVGKSARAATEQHGFRCR